MDAPWDVLKFSIPDITPEDARTFARVLNTPGGQDFLKGVAESLVGLRKATKRRKYKAPTKPATSTAELPLLLTVDEVAGLLRTSVDGVYARIERGQLVDGVVRDGRKLLFHRDRLLRSLERAADGRQGGRR